MQQALNAGKTKNLGFTIVEIMTVVVISAILITAAIPGYENFVRNNQSLMTSTRLAASIRLAKAEAIKRGIPITVCAISSSFNPTAAFNESTEEWPCQTGAGWNAWKVFEDPNFDATEDFTNGWPIIEYVKSPINNAITSDSAGGKITFDPMGFVNLTAKSGWSASSSSGEWGWTYNSSAAGAGASMNFTITPPGCSGNNARIVAVSVNGTVTITHADCP